VLVGIVGGGIYLAWTHVAPHLLAGSEFKLDPRQIDITPIPPWIHTDIRGEVVRDGSLDGQVSLLDDQLAERIYKAFALHPWVAKVVRVTMGNPVKVELVYRKPVCMVEVPGGLYPIDDEAVLLPSRDFSPIEARKYPRLSGIQTVTEGPVGTRWQDVRVIGAAQLAAVLVEDWEMLGLHRIAPSVASSQLSAAGDVQFEIFSRKGSRVIWGVAPHVYHPGEPTAAEKLARLKKYVADRGSLEGTKGPQDLDVRNGSDIVATPRIASADETDLR
jgi:hypothetical protein